MMYHEQDFILTHFSIQIIGTLRQCDIIISCLSTWEIICFYSGIMIKVERKPVLYLKLHQTFSNIHTIKLVFFHPLIIIQLVYQSTKLINSLLSFYSSSTSYNYVHVRFDSPSQKYPVHIVQSVKLNKKNRLPNEIIISIRSLF